MLDFNMDSLPYHYQSNLEESMEKLRCNLFPQEEQLDPELYCGAEEPLDFVAQFGKTDDQEENLKFLEIPPLDIGGYDIFTEGHPIETTPDKTSDKTNFSHPSGAVTPGVMVIPTPSKKEQPRRPRKRRSLFDEMIVLPNEVLRQSIHDSSSLVAKRRKVPHTALDAWRNHKISSLQQNFSEPLFPYISSELKILFYNNNLNTPEPVEDAEGPSKLGEVKFETPRDSVERRPIFQENSIDHSTSAWSLESPTYVKPNREEVPIPVARVDLSPSETQDLVLSLMDEDICPYEENNPELGGCSVRTRAVARYLQKRFLNKKKQKENQVLNLACVLEGRTRKESARLFYEILVLKTQGFVDVKQETCYDDILVLTTPHIEAVP